MLFCAGYLLQDTTSVFYCCLTGILRTVPSTVPAAPPIRLPIPNPNLNPNPKTHPNPNPNPKNEKIQNDTGINFNIVIYITYFP